MKLRKSVQASLVRAAFLFQGLVGIFFIAYITGMPYYLVICAAVVLFMVELITTLRCNENGEWRWFIPVVVLYIALSVSVVWIIELSLLNVRVSINATYPAQQCTVRLVDISLLDESEDDCVTFDGGATKAVDPDIGLKYNAGETFSTVYQQIFMLILILGRWFMPKGGLTSDELSQLLLVYVASAADMLEFSVETLRLPEIACNKPIFLAILAVWTWSLLHFAFGQTFSAGRAQTVIDRVVDRRADQPPVTCATYLCGSEIWATWLDVMLVDGPYFIIRFYVIVTYRIIDNILIFFVVKNFLLIVIRANRVAILVCDTWKARKENRDQSGENGLEMTAMDAEIANNTDNNIDNSRDESNHDNGELPNSLTNEGFYE